MTPIPFWRPSISIGITNYGPQFRVDAQCLFCHRFRERENVEAIVFAGAVPILIGGAELGAEGFVEGLAGAGASMAVDFAEIRSDAADEGGFENFAVALVFV